LESLVSVDVLGCRSVEYFLFGNIYVASTLFSSLVPIDEDPPEVKIIITLVLYLPSAVYRRKMVIIVRP